ncbi:terminase small subunit [Methylosinus sp. KRF6]|uniref:terminase small subunit n=1 Tax=Methylosinus sp. KRF6 TaxID=2846853 RepID=UPI001C0AEDC9|nr:terminase small subunit [Methylosinus sp. KRF6]MBU3887630.1 terminase small subunit [Methylosinus sp. KRF6]
MARDGLNARQQRFVEEYLIDLNASAAYQRAGYTARGNAAEVNAAKLLRNTQVAAAIELAMSERSLRTEITADRVLKELSCLSFFDIGDAFNPDGSLKRLYEMREDLRRAIAGFEVTEIHNEDGVVIGHTKKVKFADKIGALEKVMRHLGMFDKDKLAVKFENPLSVLIQQVQGKAFNPVVINGGKLLEGDTK